MSPVPPMMTSFMMMSLSVRDGSRCRLPIVMREFAFGGEPVAEILTIPPTASLVEVVREPGDLVARRAVASAGVLGHRSFACEGRLDVGERHKCSFHWCQNGCAFVLDQEHQQPGRLGRAGVSADDMHVVQALVKGLAGPQRDGSPASDLHDDAALQYVDDRLRVMRMHRIDVPRGVLDGDQRELSGRIPRKIFGYQ